jgi:hypothetical protein
MSSNPAKSVTVQVLSERFHFLGNRVYQDLTL